MEITFLGTSAMVPTKDRNHSGIFYSYKNYGLLFDCGEGIQRQFKMAGINPGKITHLFISHWHGDHVLGIPGLSQTLAANEFDRTLKVYGPKGTKGYIENMLKGFAYDSGIDMDIHELEDDKGKIVDNMDFSIEYAYLDHSLPCIGFKFIEKDRRRIDKDKQKELGIPDGPILGRLQRGQETEFEGRKYKPEDVTYTVPGKIVGYVADTRMCANCLEIAKDNDFLICEATHLSDIEDKADKYGHLTSQQAAMIANQANVKELMLTHFSQRYKTVDALEEEARDIFRNTTCAYDLLTVKL